jgi:hypothetical protein
MRHNRDYPGAAPSSCLILLFKTHVLAARLSASEQSHIPARSARKGVVIFKKVADLKGKHPDESIKDQLPDGFHPREQKVIRNWAEPGKIAIFFYKDSAALMCIGPYWYQSARQQAPWWELSYGRPELSLSCFGTGRKAAQARGRDPERAGSHRFRGRAA